MKLKVSFLKGHEQMTLKTCVTFNRSGITLEFQAGGHVVPVLSTVTVGRNKKFIMRFSTRKLSIELFRVAGRKCQS